jgi:hypothetical protein
VKLFTRVVAEITCGFWKTLKIFWIIHKASNSAGLKIVPLLASSTFIILHIFS